MTSTATTTTTEPVPEATRLRRAAVCRYIAHAAYDVGSANTMTSAAEAVAADARGTPSTETDSLLYDHERLQRLDLLDLERRIDRLGAGVAEALTQAEGGEVDVNTVRSATTKTRTILHRLERLSEGADAAHMLLLEKQSEERRRRWRQRRQPAAEADKEEAEPS